MIEDSPILRLKRNFPRLIKADVDSLSNTPTGFIVDCMNGRGSLYFAIKSLLPISSSIVGIAVTCECGPADNLGVFGALDIAQAGDIVVASTDSHTSTAVIGDLVLEIMNPAPIKAPAMFEEFEKPDNRIGTIAAVSDVEKPDKPMKLTGDFGDHRRSTLAGIKRERQNPREIDGRQALLVVNLPEQEMAGEASEGMLFDIGYSDGLVPCLAMPERPVPNGTRAG